MKLDELFCDIDDFCLVFEPQLISKLMSYSGKKRLRKTRLSDREIMTIIVYFHHSSYRDFKHYYLQQILKYHWSDFPSFG